MTNLIKYRPLDFLQDINKEINQFFNNKNWFFNERFFDVETDHWTPYVDIKEELDKFIINVDVPGVNLKDIDISINDNRVLTIKGERNLEHSNKDKDYSRMERISGKFYRQFSLPDYIDSEHVQATIKDGVLSIIALKSKEHTVKKIKIEPAEKILLEDKD